MGMTGHLNKPADFRSPSMIVTIVDVIFSMTAIGRSDNESYENLVSPTLSKPPCNKGSENFARFLPSS